jgi:hypothetical protein
LMGVRTSDREHRHATPPWLQPGISPTAIREIGSLDSLCS